MSEEFDIISSSGADDFARTYTVHSVLPKSERYSFKYSDRKRVLRILTYDCKVILEALRLYRGELQMGIEDNKAILGHKTVDSMKRRVHDINMITERIGNAFSELKEETQ